MFRRCWMCAMTMLLMAGIWGSAWAQTPEELIAIRGAFDAALNAHDLDQMMTYWTDDGVWDVPAVPPPAEGKEAVRTELGGLLQGLPDIQTTEGLILASGNVVVVEHVATGTHQGVWMGIAATGRSVQIVHMDIYEFEGDKIKKLTSYIDNMSIMIQLGLMPAGELPPLEPSFDLPDPEPTRLSPMEAAGEAVRRWNTHDLSLFTKMIRPDGEFLFGPFGVPMHRDAYISVFELFFLGISDIYQDIVRSIDMGDGWVLVESIVGGTHDGPFLGIPASNNYNDTRVAWIARFDADGLVMNMNIYWDFMDTLIGMGAVPSPTTVLPTTWGQIKSLFQE